MDGKKYGRVFLEVLNVDGLLQMESSRSSLEY